MRRLILALALVAPGGAWAGRRHETLLFDRMDMTATLGAPLGRFSSEKTYFESTPLPGGNVRVADIREGACRGVYDLSPNGRMIHRTRTLRVLEGEFGHVYVHLHYWYPPESPRVAIGTFADKRGVPHLPPLIAASGSGSIDGYALIRVMKAPDRYLIASGDYALDGARKAFRIDVSTGDWARSLAGEPPALYGLPEAIDPAGFTAFPFPGEAEENVELEAALIFRGRGTTIERVVRRGSRVERDWLSFPPTEIDRALSRTESSYPITRER